MNYKNGSEYLKTAVKAAQAAEKLIKHYYRKSIDVNLKDDNSPVTVADIEAENAIKSIILNAFPEHGIYGEETGYENSNADYLWLIDPIDGTKSFIRQSPFFSTQIALMNNQELILGVSNAPEFGELAYAEMNHGAYLNEQSIHVSEIGSIEGATLSVGNIKSLAKSNDWQNFAKLIGKVNRVRGYGDFYHYHLLARGTIDLVIESDVNILDIAALTVIIREAGGIVTDLKGQAINLNSRNILAANNPILHSYVNETVFS